MPEVTGYELSKQEGYKAMAMEFVREPLKINQAVGKELVQFSVQGDVLIPDVKPDIVKVLCIDSSINESEREVSQDRITVGGTVDFNIVYMCSDEDAPVRGLNASLPFNEIIELAGVRQGVDISINPDTLNTEYQILNERKVSVKAIAQIRVKADTISEVPLVTDVTGIEDIQKLREALKVCSYIGQGTEKCVIRDEMELPAGNLPVFEMLKINTRINKDIKVSDDRLVVRGEANVTALYAAEDRESPIQSIEHEIPFTQFVDIPGLHEGALCDVDAAVKDVNVRPVDNEEGDPRILDYEITVEIRVRGFEWCEKESVTDTYSPSYRMEIEAEEINTSQLALESGSQLILKDTFELPEAEEINQVYAILCKPCVSSMEINRDKTLFEGVVDVWILYKAGEDGGIACYRHEIPYSNTVEVKGAETGMSGYVNIDVEHKGYTPMAGGEIEVRVVLSADVKLYRESQLNIVNRFEPVEIDIEEFKAQPSLTLYYVQPDDSLWRIGKKFSIPISELMELNNISDPESISAEQQLLIQKRII